MTPQCRRTEPRKVRLKDFLNKPFPSKYLRLWMLSSHCIPPGARRRLRHRERRERHQRRHQCEVLEPSLEGPAERSSSPVCA